MKGLTIFSHSLRQITGNLGMALRVSGWLVAIYAVIAVLFWWWMPDWLTAAMAQDVQGVRNAADLSAGNVGMVLVLAIGLGIFLLWAVSLVAIVWHRYILMEEIPQGIIPYRGQYRIGRYFWYGIGISLLAVMVVAVPLIIGLAFAAFPIVSAALSGLFQWFYFMLNISVLSTLYGHIIQKREVY
jgi:hypothetical protein